MNASLLLVAIILNMEHGTVVCGTEEPFKIYCRGGGGVQYGGGEID